MGAVGIGIEPECADNVVPVWLLGRRWGKFGDRHRSASGPGGIVFGPGVESCCGIATAVRPIEDWMFAAD